MKCIRVSLCLIVFSLYYSMGNATTYSYAGPKNSEYHIKAAFLLNFAKFVDWPSYVFPDNPLTLNIYILGRNPFDGALKTIENKIVKERRLVIKTSSRIEEIKECQILFICTSEKENLSEILAKIKDRPILTVAETDNFCQSGGILNFIVVKNKVRFEINADAAKRTGLKISSKLLKLSKIINER